MHRFPRFKAVESSIERAQRDEEERDHHLDVISGGALRYQGMSDRSLAAYLEDMQERAEIEQLRRTVRMHGKLTATDLY